MVVPNILCLEHAIVCLLNLQYFVHNEANLLDSVFEYTYLILWNVFWTLCPVIAIGVFDRFIGMLITHIHSIF